MESKSPLDRSWASCLLGHIYPLLSKHNHKRSLDKKSKNEANIDQKNLLHDHQRNKEHILSSSTSASVITSASTSVSQGRICESASTSNINNVSPPINTSNQASTSNITSVASPIHTSNQNSNNASPSSGKRGTETPLAIAVLSFLLQNDPSEAVRQSARLALLDLGTEGQEAIRQVQLSSNGFQGVQMTPPSGNNSAFVKT